MNAVLARLVSAALDIVYLLTSLVVGPPLLIYLRLIKKRRFGAIGERFGGIRVPRASAPRVWIHAVSVGELEAATPLIRALEQRGQDVVISTTTTSAQALAKRRFDSSRVFLFPLDLGFAVRRALRAIRPQLVVLMELEVWPNHVLNTRLAGIPIVVSNARISARGFARMRRWRVLFAAMLSGIDTFLVQNETYRERLAALGVDGDRLQVVGNLKFERALIDDAQALRREFDARHGIAADRWRWIAGSTHPEEDDAILDAHAALIDDGGDPLLILAPRHVERAAAMRRAIEKRGFEFADFRSAALSGAIDVLLVDVTGELARLYACADVAFVGGSLVARGGHNILEPILAGTPTLHGPHMMNFREEVRGFTDRGGAKAVRDAADLADQLRSWRRDPASARAIADRGGELLAMQRGVVDANVRAIGRLLGATGDRLAAAQRSAGR